MQMLGLHLQRESVVALSLVLLVACGTEPKPEIGPANELESSSSTDALPSSTGESGENTTTSSTTDPDPGESTTDPGTSTSTSTTGGDGPEPPRLDAAPLPDLPPKEEGCRAVDFLFVIDNSGSMASHQANLINNFPAFIEGIESSLKNVDTYNVGVVTTDAYTQNVAGCNVLGGLVVRTGVGMCGPYDAGWNFMTEEDDLATAFSCAGNVGTAGSATERPMNAMENAINGMLANDGQCNEAFIRDEALLVIIIITDEPDSSTGDPTTWYQTVVAAKNDTPENAAVVAFLTYDALPEEAPSPCPANNAAYAEIPAFVRSFGENGENGFLGGICQVDYGPTFEQAIGVISNACENFVPPPS